MRQYFDPALAEFPTRVVAIREVLDLLQVSHAPERIGAYRDAMQAGAVFPPISVIRVGGRYLIADGHKRFSAYRMLPVNDILVEVWTLRRVGRDQWQQLGRKTRQQLALLRASAQDPSARRAVRRLALDTVGHWRRVLRSLSAWRRDRAAGARE
jgi:hypothetical protein